MNTESEESCVFYLQTQKNPKKWKSVSSALDGSEDKFTSNRIVVSVRGNQRYLDITANNISIDALLAGLKATKLIP